MRSSAAHRSNGRRVLKQQATRAGAGVFLVVLACASNNFGPVGHPEFESTLRSTVDTGGEEILLSTIGQLWEGRNGYDAQREWFGSYPVPREGVLVFLETKMILAGWDRGASSYHEQLTIPYDAIRDLRWDLHGVGKMVVFDAVGHDEKITVNGYNWTRNATAMRILGERSGPQFDLNAPAE